MKFKVGDKVHSKYPGFGFEGTDGVVVGYWTARDLPPFNFTTDEAEANTDFAYPYFVRGFIASDEDLRDDQQALYAEDELEIEEV